MLEKWLPPEDREQQAQQDAENDAGDNRKIERGMSALDPNVAGQPSQPLRHEPAPHRQSHQRGHYANDGDEFPQLAHIQKVARIERRHKLESECLYNSEIITK